MPVERVGVVGHSALDEANQIVSDPLIFSKVVIERNFFDRLLGEEKEFNSCLYGQAGGVAFWARAEVVEIDFHAGRDLS